MEFPISIGFWIGMGAVLLTVFIYIAILWLMPPKE